MRVSSVIAAEAQKTSIAVTYDLAIVNIAMQIYQEETTKYDVIFTALGSFQTEMVLVK